jgi:hypothetical protein
MPVFVPKTPPKGGSVPAGTVRGAKATGGSVPVGVVGGSQPSNFTPISQVRSSGGVFVPKPPPGADFTPIGQVKAGRFTPKPPPGSGGPPKKHGGGFFHGLVHAPGRVASDLYHAAVSSPAAGYTLAKHGVQDVAGTVETLVPAVRHRGQIGAAGRSAPPKTGRLAADVKAVGQQTVEDIKHPLRHPGYTLLDVLGAASFGAGVASRLGAAGKALAETGRVGDAAEALATRPRPAPRVLEHQGVRVKVPAAASPVTRAAQKGLDRLSHAFPDVPAIGAAGRVSRELRRETRHEANLRRAPVDAFVAKAKAAGMLRRGPTGHFTDEALAKQHALRVVAEGVPTPKRIEFHRGELKRGYHVSARQNEAIAQMRQRDFETGHAEQVRLNLRARGYLREAKGGRPVFADPQIAEVYQAAQKVTGNREELLALLDKLDPVAAEGRLHAPGRVLLGARWEKTPAVKARAEHVRIYPREGAQVSTSGEFPAFTYTIRGPQLQRKLPAREAKAAEAKLVGAEGFTGGEMRIPTVPGYKQPRSSKLPPAVGAGDIVNTVKELGTLRHPYKGGAYLGGKIRNDVVNLINESALEAHRYWTLLHVRDRLVGASKDAPTSKYDVPIRVEELPGQPAAREIIARLEENHVHNPESLAVLSHGYEAMRQALFPIGQGQRVEEFVGIPGVKFVDRRLLGGLDKPNPLLGLMQHGTVRGSVAVLDAINNATRLSVLYLKPAYLAPNLVGNVGMNIVQQGFAAPRNLRNAARLNAEAGPDVVAGVDALMGEGISGALSSQLGPLSQATHFGARQWSRVVDLLPRRAAFLHEAWNEGYRTGDELQRLLTDPGLHDDLLQITKRANRAIIDYGDLGPVEQAIVRRVIFFYPWIKGASKWGVSFVADHPVQAAAVGALGQQGEQIQQGAFPGGLPSYAQALIPTGSTSHGLPTTLNPAATSILQTPAEVGAGLASIARGKGTPLTDLGSFLAPGPTLATQALKGQGRKGLADLIASQPLTRLAGQGRPSKTYPYQNEAVQRLLYFLFGGSFVPRATNPYVLARSAQREKRGH